MSIARLSPPDSPRIDGESDEHIRTLAESDSPLPPILVHRDTMRVIDGAHRLRVAGLRGASHIDVRYFTGTEAEAFVLAVEANVTHGLPLSRADRVAATERILHSHPHWSDRAVAAVTGLAAKTVASIRRRTTDEAQADVVSRTGRDGRVRPTDAAGGRRRAGQLLRQDPTASIRKIAKQAGVSSGTVRDVRDRLARGEDPVPARQRGPCRTELNGDSAPKKPPAPAEVPGLRSDARFLLLDQLRQDPSIRFSEAGRQLLRALNTQAAYDGKWDRLLEAVPEHCQSIVAELVRACAESWQELVVRLDQDGLTRSR